MKRPEPPTSDILIATLGTEPQVVSAAHNLLRVRDYPIQRVMVLHTEAREGPIAESVVRLQEHYAAQPEASASLETRVIRDEHSFPVRDTVRQREVDAVFRSVYGAVAEAKQDGLRVHLLIAGGRKTMSVYGMVAAQILFGEEDRLWHLYSSGEYLYSKRMQPRKGDEVSLVAVPVIRWSAIPPTYFNLQQYTDPYEALDRVNAVQLEQQLAKARVFLEQELTPAQARVASLMAAELLTDEELAAKLDLSVKTVGQHLYVSYQKARVFFGVEDMDRHMLTHLLSLYFKLKGEEHET